MNISFQSFGAAQEVTGSKHLFTFGDRRVLVDCGMFQGRRAQVYEKNRTLGFNPQELDAAILSHGHFDHCGNLPALVRAEVPYAGNIYATSATRDIANLIMMDTAHIMAKDYEYLVAKHRDKQAYPPLYAERDVLSVLDHFVTLHFHRPFPVVDGVTAEFLNAGHILGSALTVFAVKEGGTTRRVAFTGDLGRPVPAIIAGPETLPPVDYLLCEGTYGTRRHDPTADAMGQLATVIRETSRRGGKVIIPSFAVGRTQELLFFLHLLKDAGQIPDLDIFLDSPMAVNATGIFRVHQECYNEAVRKAFLDHHENPFGFASLKYVVEVEESKALNNRLDPCIIISGSGMCEGGRILHHLKNHIGDPRHTILVVGFMAANTLGRAIADRRPTVKIFGVEYPLKARVKILNAFSGHADYEEIRQYVAKLDLQRLRRIYLVHGEPDALTNLRGVLLGSGVRSVEIVEPDRTYELFKD